MVSRIWIFLVVVLTACSVVRPPESASSTGSSAETSGAYPTVDKVGEGSKIAGDSSDPLHAPGSILSQRSIYFDFDSSLIKSEYQDLVKAHSRYLLEHPSRFLIIQGNTDKRGSAEYNLALGQRRSAAVKSTMRVLGVPERQLEAVSFGKEKLRALGNDEASHAQNRRADLVYDGE